LGKTLLVPNYPLGEWFVFAKKAGGKMDRFIFVSNRRMLEVFAPAIVLLAQALLKRFGRPSHLPQDGRMQSGFLKSPKGAAP
jgi:hypothetical protein